MVGDPRVKENGNGQEKHAPRSLDSDIGVSLPNFCKEEHVLRIYVLLAMFRRSRVTPENSIKMKKNVSDVPSRLA